MGKLTTRVTDTTKGLPASGVKIALYRIGEDGLEPLHSTVSNIHGTTDRALLEGASFTSGQYQLVFSTMAYFVRSNTPLAPIPFLDDIVIRFGVADHSQDFHLPLMISPYGYSIYRE